MKQIKFGLGALLLACAFTASAQTFAGGVKQMYQAFETATNWNVAVGYGRGFSGVNNNLAYADLAYNIVTSDSGAGVGLVLGDEILFGKGHPQISTVGGGINLNAVIAPLGFLGGSFTNFTAKVWAADLVATPQAANDVGNLVITGASFKIVDVKNFEIGASAGWENRQGQGRYDGNYGLFMLTATRMF
jgi:hypothetical protein